MSNEGRAHITASLLERVAIYLVPGLSRHAQFARVASKLLAGERALFALFLVLSVAGALTEGATIAMLAPLLEAQAGNSTLNAIPFVGVITSNLQGLEPNSRIQTIALMIATVVLLRAVLLYCVDVMSNVIPLRIERRLNLQSYDALMGVEIGYVNEHASGTLLNAIQGWPQRVTEMLTACGTFTVERHDRPRIRVYDARRFLADDHRSHPVHAGDIATAQIHHLWTPVPGRANVDDHG